MPTTETLRCIECEKDWTRERKRGVKPKTCLDCKARAEAADNHQPRQTKAVIVATADPELVALYMDERKVSERIATAFVIDGSEPPYQWQIDERGFSAKDNVVLDKVLADNFNESDFQSLAI